MRKSLYVLFLLLGINVWGQEQEIEPINTDRPDQNEGTYVLPKGTFQIEGGLQYSEGEFAPSLMLRYGLLKGTEIRLDTDFGKDIWRMMTRREIESMPTFFWQWIMNFCRNGRSLTT